jgi:uncharacterized protein YecA (UPF0149 family)
MFGVKGYRARETAAKLRNTRKLVTDDVRAARTGVLPDSVVANSTEVEFEVTELVADETTTPTEAELAAAELAAAEEVAAAEAAAADVVAAELAAKEAKATAAKAAADKGKGKNKKDK